MRLDGHGRLGGRSSHPAEEGGHLLHRRLDGFSGFQVGQLLQPGRSHQLDIDRLVVEVFDDDRLVVIQEQSDLGRTLEVQVQIPAHPATDLVQRGFRIVVQVAEVVRDGQDVERALGVGGPVQDGPARNAAAERPAGAHHLPAVVGPVAHLRDDDVPPALAVAAEVVDDGLQVVAAELADGRDLLGKS